MDSSEATRRVFERMLENLKGRIEPSSLEELRRLVELGRVADLDAVEQAVRRERDKANADR